MSYKKPRELILWDKMVHAPFKKVIKFDLLFMSLGILMGMGLGVFLVS